jgi:hypothetical protein
VAVVEQEQVRAQTEQQELTQTQQHQTHQAHWEKTARTTAETVVVVEPVAAVLMAEHQAMADRATTVVPVVSLVLIWCHRVVHLVLAQV